MSASKNDNNYRNYQSGMTPSIITTINNTSPTPPSNCINNNGSIDDQNANHQSKSKRPSEAYYESYIEDSFVGHWEREDNDIEDELNAALGVRNRDDPDEDDPGLHPSTIEFDFDSFGPESIIYNPSAANQHLNLEASSNSRGSQLPGPEAIDVLDTQSKHNDETTHEQIDGSPSNCKNSPISPTPDSNTMNNFPLDSTQIDLKVIEPYKKVISHAGYCHHFDTSAPSPNPGEPAPAVIIFSACYLPDRSRRDYNYVMDQLFLYVLASLHELIADDYILIYLHNTQPPSGANLSRASASSNLSSASPNNEEPQQHNNLPTFSWMKRCYQMIDRKLRKNLKILYLVKPTFWLKTIVVMCRPFISTKFSKKLRFVDDVSGLRKCLPVDKLILPASADL